MIQEKSVKKMHYKGNQIICGELFETLGHSNGYSSLFLD